MAGSTVRVALIGCGRHGRYLSQALAHVPGVERVACADVDPSIAAQAAAECGYKAAYGDPQAMLTKERPDAVIVATTHGSLADAALAAIRAGANVFVEKPLALNYDQGREVVEAARRAGARLMVGYCLRYTPVRLMMKDLLAQGAVGDVAFVNAGKGGLPHTGWLADPERGGGQLLFLGSHVTDQIFWLLGRPAERVYAEVAWNPLNKTDNTSLYTIRFAGGVGAQITCTQAVHANFDYVEIVGSAGRIRTDWPTNMVTVHSDAIAAYRHPTTIRVNADAHLTMYVAELTEFVASVREKRPPAVTGEDGLRVLEILDAVVKSGKSAKPVDVGTLAVHR